MKHVTWYFDILSPFAYLQNHVLGTMTNQIVLDRKPVLLVGLLQHWGTKGPAELPPKRQFTYRHIIWMAQRMGVPIQFPDRHPFNPIPLLRLIIAAGSTKAAVDAIFDGVYVQGLTGDNPDHWSQFCSAVGLDVDEANRRISSPDVKKELIDNGKAAIDKGVFGVPTLIIDNELFWGLDSTGMAMAFLADSSLFDNPAMQGIDSMEQQQRK